MLKKFFLFAGLFMAACVLNAQNNPLILKYFVSDAAAPKIRLNTQGDFAFTYIKNNNAALTGSGSGTTGLTEIIVPSTGSYTVSLIPTGPFKFTNGVDGDKVTEITQWGNVNWSPDLSSMFNGYSNLQITASDIPDFSNVTNMSGMFYGCTNFSIANGINNWNVSNVTNMAYMFGNAPAFNKDISNWNTSNVTNMNGMFAGATQFNQPIGNWNVANVTDMSNMFYSSNFNQNLSTWNVGNVTTMYWMFTNAQQYNQPIGNWNVGNVLDMENMFNGAHSFNQNLGNWQLAPIVNLAGIFSNNGIDCNNFGATLKGWAENPNTPLGRLFGVNNRTYGPGGEIYINQLVNNKGWTFSGSMYNNAGCTETFLSVEDVKQGKTKLTLYPNPATETVFIKSEQRAKTVQLIDASGKMVLNAAATSQISVQHLPAGIYFVKVTLADGSQSTHKLIKK